MNSGKLGEEVVAQWLIERGGEILHRRWRWKRGEIDLIAIESNTLLFIEVKARNSRNWDADGLLAINQQKQTRLIRSAELFLARHPHLTEHPCRFDVAIVRHQPISRKIVETPLYLITDIATNECLLLLDYLPNAFETY